MKEREQAVVEKTVTELLSALGTPYQKLSFEDIAGQTICTIHAEDGRPLIGRDGETIQAIDLVVKKIVERLLFPQGEKQEEGAKEGEEAPGVHFLVDVNGYRAKHITDLQTKALMMAERARSLQYDVELSPMSAYERLIVHTTLQDAPNVKTESQGEGRGRRVVIRYTS